MAQNLATSSKRNYGSTNDRMPDVNFSGTQFSPTEMFVLSDKISATVSTINSSYKILDHSLKNIGTPRDSVEERNKLHDNQSKTNICISQSTKDLQRLSLIVKRGDKKQKLQVDKLTTNFTEAVKSYGNIQKKVADKLKQHIMVKQQPLVYAEHEPDNEEDIIKEQLVKEMEFEKGLLIEREQRIEEIEEVVIDVNKIMQELGAIILQQGENINSIEESIESSHASVEAGARELEKASSYSDKRRRKTCVLLAISVTIGIFLAIIIAVTLK